MFWFEVFRKTIPKSFFGTHIFIIPAILQFNTISRDICIYTIILFFRQKSQMIVTHTIQCQNWIIRIVLISIFLLYPSSKLMSTLPTFLSVKNPLIYHFADKVSIKMLWGAKRSLTFILQKKDILWTSWDFIKIEKWDKKTIKI